MTWKLRVCTGESGQALLNSWWLSWNLQEVQTLTRWRGQEYNHSVQQTARWRGAQEAGRSRILCRNGKKAAKAQVNLWEYWGPELTSQRDGFLRCIPANCCTYTHLNLHQDPFLRSSFFSRLVHSFMVCSSLPPSSRALCFVTFSGFNFTYVPFPSAGLSLIYKHTAIPPILKINYIDSHIPLASAMMLPFFFL